MSTRTAHKASAHARLGKEGGSSGASSVTHIIFYVVAAKPLKLWSSTHRHTHTATGSESSSLSRDKGRAPIDFSYQLDSDFGSIRQIEKKRSMSFTFPE